MKRVYLTLLEKQRINDLMGEDIHSLPENQAERVIAKFGGVPHIHKALANVGCAKNKSTIHRWRYPVEVGGTGGIIPPRVWPYLVKAAHSEGIILTSEDLDPSIKVS